MRKPNEVVPLQVRLTEGLRKRLAKAAEANHRSLNSEITFRLEQSLATPAEELTPMERIQKATDQMNEAVEEIGRVMMEEQDAKSRRR